MDLTRQTANLNAAPAAPSAGKAGLTGRGVFLMLAGFFGVIILVNALMVSIALDTMPGTTVEGGYRASQRYNAELAAARIRDARGWAVEARVVRDAAGSAAATLSVRDGEGAPVDRVTVDARLEHPVRRAADRRLDMARAGTGLYAGTADDVSPGVHDLVVEVRREGEVLYRSRNRIVLP